MGENNDEYWKNYKLDTLYVGPEKGGGKYLTLVTMDVSSRVKMVLQAYYVNECEDISGFKLIKLKNEKEDGIVNFSTCTLDKIKEFYIALQSLNLKETSSSKLKLNPEADLEQLRQIFNEKENLEDFYALAQKREVLVEFKNKLNNQQTSEPEWQEFFERNPWIFGHGLNYVFVDRVKKQEKLEQIVKGSDFNSSGKRVDALMRTRAEISQYVLIEIKKAATLLLDQEPYRSGCWRASPELSGAIAQIQKTAYEFKQNRLKDEIKDEDGNLTGEIIYSIEPKSYLVIGRNQELAKNTDKIISFEFLRKSMHSPEIITFDELYERAKCIIENLSGKQQKQVTN